MNKETYNKETIYSYLLGSLTGAETENFDELTIVDKNFAEAVNAAEKDLVDSYVQNELSGPTLTQFESHYLASPVRRQRVDFARAFQRFAETSLTPEARVTETVFTPVKLAGRPAGFFGWLPNFGGMMPAFRFAAAAAALVVVATVGWLMIRGLNDGQNGGERASTTNQTPINAVNQPIVQVAASPTVIENPVNSNGSNGKIVEPSRTPEPKSVPMPKAQPVVPSQPVIAAITLLPPLRGGGKLVQLALKPHTDAADFTINLESSEYSSYSIDLRETDSGKSIWQGTRKKPSVKGVSSSLAVRVPARLLKSSKVYSFVVAGVAVGGTAENIGDYTFRVVR